ncbi:hypothetical protein PENTCL1PPCAC_15376, partial [Pristionchus entomophagus]
QMDDFIQLSILYSINGVAIVANIMLIAVIARRTPKAMRSFSIFLLNTAIVDILTVLASATIAVRVVCLPDLRIVYVYIGQYATIGGSAFCRICKALQMCLVNGSTAILLLTFGYRRHIISAGNALLNYPLR